MGDERLVDALIVDYSPASFLLKFLFVIMALVLGVLAVMNPRKPGESAGITRKGIDIAVALDVSNSMLATDLAPNRLERAKQFLSRMMNSRPDDRIALVLFAGQAYLQMPLTVDHGAAQLYISSAGPDAIPQQGTVLSEALEKSGYALAGSANRFKSIVLISDGEDHDADAVSMAKKLTDEGIMINTIGIGSPEGTTIPDPRTGGLKKDESGNPVISRLDETTLNEIAEATNGVYIKLESSEAAITTLDKQLAQIESKAFTDLSQVNFKTYYYWLVAGMFVLLLVEIFISEKRRTNVDKHKPRVA